MVLTVPAIVGISLEIYQQFKEKSLKKLNECISGGRISDTMKKTYDIYNSLYEHMGIYTHTLRNT